jgi:branched-chain amino acid transport system substrate-binding protein
MYALNGAVGSRFRCGSAEPPMAPAMHERSDMRRMCRSARGRIIVWTTVCLVVLIAAAAATAGGTRSAASAPYKITLSMDLSGPISFNGKLLAGGFEAGVAYLNNHGGVNKRKINLTVLDDASDLAKGRANFQQAVDQKSLGIFGFLLGPIAIATYPLAEQNQLPIVSLGSVSADLVKDHPWYFTNEVGVPESAHVFVQYIAQRAKKDHIAKPRVAIFTVLSGASPVTAIAVQAEMEKRGMGDPVTIQTMPVAPTDVTAQAVAIAKSDPDYVILVHNDLGALIGTKALRQQGVKVPVINFSAGSADSTFATLATNYIAYRTYVSPRDTSVPAIKQMVNASVQLGYANLATNSYYTQGWVFAVNVLKSALQKCGACKNGAAFRNALASLKKVDTGGLSGTLGVTSANHSFVHFVRFFTWSSVKNKAIPATKFGWIPVS